MSSGGVEVIVPQQASDERAGEFLIANETWTVAQIDAVARLVASPASHDDTLLLRGERVRVTIDSGRRPRVSPSAGVLHVDASGGAEAARVLERWLRREARRDIEAAVARRSREMGVAWNRIYVMDQRTRWGGSSALGNLSFRWRLVMAPPEVLDYVVVHELAHRLESRHSTKFWLIVQQWCPRFEDARRWLRENAAELVLPAHIAG